MKRKTNGKKTQPGGKLPTGGKLTPRQKLFVQEYLKDMNASRAYKAAGYLSGNDEAVQAGASRLLWSVKLSQAVHGELLKRFQAVEITADRVLREIAKIAFCNMADFLRINPDGTFAVDLSSIDRDAGAAIQDAVTMEGEHSRSVKIKLHSKLSALDMLGKYLKLFNETTPAVSAEGNALLADALAGKVSLRDAAYKFNMMGLPLPEALKIEWSKQESKPSDTAQGAVTNDEIMRRYEEQMRLVGEQIAETMPERAVVVAELKKELENRDMFASGYGRLEP